MRLRSFVAVAAVLSASLFAHADTLVGDTVHDYYLNPSTGIVEINYGVQTVTNGLTDSEPNVTLQFSGNQLIITNLDAGVFATESFNGFQVNLLSGSPFASVVYDPSTSILFAGSMLSFSSDQISINLSGTCSACAGGEKIVLDVNASSVTPEPSSIALLGSGLLGVAGVVRKRFA